MLTEDEVIAFDKSKVVEIPEVVKFKGLYYKVSIERSGDLLQGLVGFKSIKLQELKIIEGGDERQGPQGE